MLANTKQSRGKRKIEVKGRECTGNKSVADSLGSLLEAIGTSAENVELSVNDNLLCEYTCILGVKISNH